MKEWMEDPLCFAFPSSLLQPFFASNNRIFPSPQSSERTHGEKEKGKRNKETSIVITSEEDCLISSHFGL